MDGKQTTTSPHVSIIIPVYNAEAWLARCLDSVVGQTFHEIEIILVDDGSTDHSFAIAENYAKDDGRMTIIRQENGGCAAARNAALAVATGEYIGFVDADDYIGLDFFEKLYARAKETGADMVKGEERCTNFDGTSVVYGTPFDDIRENKAYLTFTFWSCIYKNNFLKKNDLRFMAGLMITSDSQFLVRASLLANAIELVEGVYYHYIRREDSLASQSLNDDKVRAVATCATSIVDFINRIPLDEKTYTIAFSIWTTFLLRNTVYRTSSLEMRAFLVETTMALFKGCKHRDACVEAMPSYARFFALDDKDGLLMHVLQCSAEDGGVAMPPESRVTLFSLIPLLNGKRKGKTMNYFLFHFIPLLQVRHRPGKKVYRLFFLFPLWYVCDISGARVHKILGMIPVFKWTLK